MARESEYPTDFYDLQRKLSVRDKLFLPRNHETLAERRRDFNALCNATTFDDKDASRTNCAFILEAFDSEEYQRHLPARNTPKYAETLKTAFYLATSYGNTENVKALIKAGVCLERARGVSAPPLHHATEHDHRAILIELLAAGANVIAQDDKGKTALDLCFEHIRSIARMGGDPGYSPSLSQALLLFETLTPEEQEGSFEKQVGNLCSKLESKGLNDSQRDVIFTVIRNELSMDEITPENMRELLCGAIRTKYPGDTNPLSQFLDTIKGTMGDSCPLTFEKSQQKFIDDSNLPPEWQEAREALQTAEARANKPHFLIGFETAAGFEAPLQRSFFLQSSFDSNLVGEIFKFLDDGSYISSSAQELTTTLRHIRESRALYKQGVDAAAQANRPDIVETLLRRADPTSTPERETLFSAIRTSRSPQNILDALIKYQESSWVCRVSDKQMEKEPLLPQEQSRSDDEENKETMGDRHRGIPNKSNRPR